MAGNWTKLTIEVSTKDLDEAAAVISMLDNGLMIEDYSDFSLNGMYGELVDESILNADKSLAKISIFVPEEKNLLEYITFIEAKLSSLGIPFTKETEGMQEENWADSWKKYFKPIPLGRVTIVPAWETYEAKEGEIIVSIDPGMAFGTGTHETTRLCATLLEKYVTPSTLMLDVGTGSGILAICASKLGAKKCYAYDIDPVAVRVARENVKDNDANNIECEVSDLLKGVFDQKYDVIAANIVADIIIRMLPDIGKYMHENTTLVISGIIDERCEDVYKSIKENSFNIVEEIHENGWCAISLRQA